MIDDIFTDLSHMHNIQMIRDSFLFLLKGSLISFFIMLAFVKVSIVRILNRSTGYSDLGTFKEFVNWLNRNIDFFMLLVPALALGAVARSGDRHDIISFPYLLSLFLSSMVFLLITYWTYRGCNITTGLKLPSIKDVYDLIKRRYNMLAFTPLLFFMTWQSQITIFIISFIALISLTSFFASWAWNNYKKRTK